LSGAVRVILEILNLARNAILVAAEINHAIMLLVTTAHMTNSDVTMRIAASGFVLAFRPACACGRPLCRFGLDNLDDTTTARRSRLDFNESHLSRPPFRKIDFLTRLEADESLLGVAATTHGTAGTLDLAFEVGDLN
jgi:hypothetical protein